MGLFMSKVYDLLSSWISDNSPRRLVMLGLDAAGKTTILYKLKLNETVTTIPTIGFNVETVQLGKGLSFTVWDVGGQDKIRPLWRYYFQNTQGLIFVVDSSDRERIEEAREELFTVLSDDLMRDVAVLVMANKQDLPGALTPAQMVEALQLRKLCNQRWHIQGVTATTGEGLYESLNNLDRLLRNI